MFKPEFYSNVYKFEKKPPAIQYPVQYFYEIFINNKKNCIKFTEDSFYICEKNPPHPAANEFSGEDCCVQFSLFKNTFAIIHNNKLYSFIPPTYFSNKNFNFFIRLIYEMKKNSQHVEKYYDNFQKSVFKCGLISSLLSGTKSFMRTAILGFKTIAIRTILTINANLGPDEIEISHRIFQKLNIATNGVRVLRHPCINTTGIRDARILIHYDETEDTRINPFICDGNNADQDGDQIQIHFFEFTHDQPSYDLISANAECLKMSFRYGHRRTIENENGWSFGQHYKYLAYRLNNILLEKSALWASLDGTPPEKLLKITKLSSGPAYKETEQFIQLLLQLNKIQQPLVTIYDIYTETGGGVLNDTVNSKARADKYAKIVFDTLNHMVIKNPNIDKEFKQNAIVAYNRKIQKNNKLSQEGKTFFDLLSSSNSNIHDGKIYDGIKVSYDNIINDFSMLNFLLNKESVDYMVNLMMKIKVYDG